MISNSDRVVEDVLRDPAFWGAWVFIFLTYLLAKQVRVRMRRAKFERERRESGALYSMVQVVGFQRVKLLVVTVVKRIWIAALNATMLTIIGYFLPPYLDKWFS